MASMASIGPLLGPGFYVGHAGSDSVGGMSGLSLKSRLGAAGLGVVAFLALQGFFALTWDRLFQPAMIETPWFMGSKPAIVATQAVLALLAFALALRASSWRERFADLGLMTAGVMAAVTALFVLIGPEALMVGPVRLWPVVLASALLLLAPAILAGTLLGGYLSQFVKISAGKN